MGAWAFGFLGTRVYTPMGPYANGSCRGAEATVSFRPRGSPHQSRRRNDAGRSFIFGGMNGTGSHRAGLANEVPAGEAIEIATGRGGRCACASPEHRMRLGVPPRTGGWRAGWSCECPRVRSRRCTGKNAHRRPAFGPRCRTRRPRCGFRRDGEHGAKVPRSAEVVVGPARERGREPLGWARAVVEPRRSRARLAAVPRGAKAPSRPHGGAQHPGRVNRAGHGRATVAVVHTERDSAPARRSAGRSRGGSARRKTLEVLRSREDLSPETLRGVDQRRWLGVSCHVSRFRARARRMSRRTL